MSYESEVLADSPVLYLRMDEVGADVDGDIWPDSSGNELHAVQVYADDISHNPPVAQARGHASPIETDTASREFRGWGDQANFEGALSGSSHLTVANDPLLQITGDFTVEEWLRPEAGGPAFPGVHYIQVGKNDFDGGDYGIGRFGAFGEITGFCRDSADTMWSVFSGINSSQSDFYNVSRHVVVTRLGNALALYINGRFVTFTTITSGLPNKVSSDPFLVQTTTAGYQQARHDEVAVYDHALSAARILAHYEAALLELSMRGEANITTSAILNGTDEPDPIAYPFRHNWSEPVVERFRWRTSVFKPTNGSTGLRRQRSAPRRQIEYQHLSYSEQLRQRFEARSYAGRTALVQFEPDKVRLPSLDTGETTAAFDTRYRDFEVDHRVLFYQDDDTYEYATLSDVTDEGIEWEEPLSRNYVNVWVKPARVARLPIEQELELQTDRYADTSTIYEYLPEDEPLNPRRIIPFTPALTYRDREAFDLTQWQGHDWNELPTIAFTSDRTELDDSTGIVTSKQYRSGGEMVQPYNMNLQGRETIARYLGWIYARAGQSNPFWMPTFRNDLTILSSLTNTLTVRGHEYTNLYATGDTRFHLAFVYLDNTTIMREIVSSAPSGANDVLTLSANVPALTNLRYLSFLRRVMLSSDDLEIAWETDSVVRVAFAVADAPLDLALGSPSVSPSPSASISTSTSPSASPSRSLSPSASASPSASMSPTISPSSSSSQSVSPSPSV